MKLTSIFFLGLGITAALASGNSNLRANTPSRQLSDSNQPSGGVWMYYLMLNALHGPLDHGCCTSHPEPRCKAPHFKCSSSSGGSGGGNDDENDDPDSRMYYNESESSISSNYLSSVSGSGTSSSGASGGAQEQYLANEYNNGGNGNAQNVGSSAGSHVWPFLAAALAVGVVAAALVTLKKVSFTVF